MRTRMLSVVAIALASVSLPLLGAQAANAASSHTSFAFKPDRGDAPQTSTHSTPKPGATLLGNDVSWPQCGRTLPSGQAFAIVGVTGGLANDTNPCFDSELAWAETSTGATVQPKVALYVNTANPGFAGSGGTWWPTSNVYPLSSDAAVDNPYGTCEGAYDPACAYMYGYAKAWDDVYLRGVDQPSHYTWWLDVETENTWSMDRTANAADLEGMTAMFHSVGARVGLYSTASMWNQIVGPLPESSVLRGLPSWLPGASSEKTAKAMCAAAPLTAGGTVTLTQFISRNLDVNVSCI
ncbi:glycoside hydrolase family 25 domain-containing protein [Cryobacterium tepidiphilum]|nr:hypothetical protein [Cryobacterium tepidiphilum]